MNWYKIAQLRAPIAITSYNETYNQLGISFAGSKTYTYENIVPDDHNYLESLLKNRNYPKAQEVLESWRTKRQETEEDRQEMLTELYDRGVLK